MAGNESLLTPTNVWLFGRVVGDLTIGTDSDPFVLPAQSNNNFLSDQLGKSKVDPDGPDTPANTRDPKFARIYGFSYTGTYYELETPALYLVHGPGAPATELAEGNNSNKNLARAPKEIGTTGLAAQDFQFAEDLLVWAFDKGDFSIRMDVSSGPLDQILLDLEGCDSSPSVAGSRVSGSRVSGSRVSGSRVSGSRVSGSRVSGSRLGGSD